ncbi:hypothetical protein NGH92_03230 [Staphylococcus succinus]|uniref:hypothetical protein n=1 Tax=Staphylococcus succinus TaxID=61015 RepID=UPI002DBD6D43|nr:hypothetical protein [Staphylococcus succinus]MEB8123828.1 hypothetical protein [Staphylococcus succinus]
MNKDFVLTSVFKEKYKDYIAITSTNNVIEVTTKRDILNELLSDLIQEYKILSIKDKKDYIHQKFKGENR